MDIQTVYLCRFTVTAINYNKAHVLLASHLSSNYTKFGIPPIIRQPLNGQLIMCLPVVDRCKLPQAADKPQT